MPRCLAAATLGCARRCSSRDLRAGACGAIEKRDSTRSNAEWSPAFPLENSTARESWRLGEASGRSRRSCSRRAPRGERSSSSSPPTSLYARRLAQEKGLESRSTFRVVDVLEQPAAVAPADIVVLNRVVCCSPDGVRLTGVAAGLAKRTLLLSFPRDRLLVRVVVRVANATLWLMGRSFRAFVHPRASLHEAAQLEGFVVTETGRGIAWEFAALRRAPCPVVPVVPVVIEHPPQASTSRWGSQPCIVPRKPVSSPDVLAGNHACHRQRRLPGLARLVARARTDRPRLQARLVRSADAGDAAPAAVGDGPHRNCRGR